MKESFLYEADDESGRYEDGETWKTAGGQVGGKYKGEIDYFDDEGAAKEFAKTGERGGESGDAASGGDTKQTGNVFNQPAAGQSDFERDVASGAYNPDTHRYDSKGMSLGF